MKQPYFRAAVMSVAMLLTGLLAGCGASGPRTVQDDALEPNNSPNEAAKISVDYQAELILQDDDWFTFTLAEGKLLQVSIEATNAQRWRTSAYIYNESAPKEMHLNFGDSETAYEKYEYFPAGDYYLQLSGHIESDTHMYSVSVSSKPFPDDALEPNNSFQTATRLEVNAEAQEMFLRERDEDWYTFTLGEPKTVVINIDDSGNSLNKMLYNSDLKVYREGWESLTTTLESGTYYVCICRDEESVWGTSYSLSVSSRPVPDASLEPNNILDEATKIGALPFSGDFFMIKGDEDWFTFSTEKEQLVTLSREDDSYHSNLKTTVHQENSAEALETSLSANGVYSLILPAGAYYLSARIPSTESTFYNGRGFDYSLDIWSDNVPEPKYEPNNSPQEAHNISLGFSEDALLVTSGDSDWFTFTLNTTTQVEIDTKSYNKKHHHDPLYVTLFDEDALHSGEFHEYPSSLTLTAGTYYIEVSSFYGAAKYGLSVTRK